MSGGIGSRHFFVTKVPYRDGWALCEKTTNFFLFSRSKRKLYKIRAILLSVWYEENKK